MKRDKFLTIFLAAVFFSFFFFGFCLARDLDVPLPGFGGESEISQTPFLPDYVRYLFNFGVGISGLVAFFVLIFGGVKYLTSAGNPGKLSDANDQMISALIGLAVILSSYMLLTTINPQLIVINPQLNEEELEPGETPGVYLCKDAAGEDCRRFTDSAVSLGDLDDQVRYIKFQNTDVLQYGAVLHQDTYYRGRCAVCLGDGCNSGYNNITYVSGVSSIHIFIRSNSSQGEGVTLYQTEDYNRRCDTNTETCYKTCSAGVAGEECGNDCAGTDWVIVDQAPGMCWGPFTSSQPVLNTTEAVWSMEINEEGKWLAAIFKSSQYRDQCEVFTKSDPNFQDGNYIGRKSIGSLIVLPVK